MDQAKIDEMRQILRSFLGHRLIGVELKPIADPLRMSVKMTFDKTDLPNIVNVDNTDRWFMDPRPLLGSVVVEILESDYAFRMQFDNGNYLGVDKT